MKSAFSSSIFLSVLLGTCSAGDIEAGKGARPHALVRKEASKNRNSEALELRSKATIKTAARSSSRQAGGTLDGLNYVPIAPDVECSSEYLFKTQGNTPELCAQECKKEGGCSIFSFRGGHNGCRISMCGNTFAQGETGIGCGTSDGKAMSVNGGCGTSEAPGASLWTLTKGTQEIQTVTLGHEDPIAPFIKLQQSVACSDRYVQWDDVDNKKDCALKCAEFPGCWMFSFGTTGCRLSACLNPGTADCGTSSELGIIAFSTQCAAEQDTNTQTYLILQHNVQATDKGCIGQYRQLDNVQTAIQCRHFCVSQEGCRLFSFGMVSGCRISSCSHHMFEPSPDLDETTTVLTNLNSGNIKCSAYCAGNMNNEITNKLPDATGACCQAAYKKGSNIPMSCTQKANSAVQCQCKIDNGNAWLENVDPGDDRYVCSGTCEWQALVSMFAPGKANGESVNMTLEDAKARCLALGSAKCGAVTCYPDNTKCRVRHSSIAITGNSFDTTYVPSFACYKDATIGHEHNCGASDGSALAIEGQCYTGQLLGDYMYNIPKKSTMAFYQTEAKTRRAPAFSRLLEMQRRLKRSKRKKKVGSKTKRQRLAHRRKSMS